MVILHCHVSFQGGKLIKHTYYCAFKKKQCETRKVDRVPRMSNPSSNLWPRNWIDSTMDHHPTHLEHVVFFVAFLLMPFAPESSCSLVWWRSFEMLITIHIANRIKPHGEYTRARDWLKTCHHPTNLVLWLMDMFSRVNPCQSKKIFTYCICLN